MKARIQIALMSCLAYIAAQVYLTFHYYPLKFAMGGDESVCNLSAKFNCDAVASSDYAALLGVPVSAWGGVANSVLFIMMLVGWLEFTDHPERTKRWALLLAGFSLVASVVMGTVSGLYMGTYCIFCLTLYVLSAIIFFSFKGVLKEPFWSNIKDDIPTLFTESKGILIAFIAIPALAFLTDRAFMANYGSPQIEAMANEAIGEWSRAPQQNFVAKPSLVMGASPEAALITLVEFADFRCSHCKAAYHPVESYLLSHPDVRLEFYSFPLDGACNEKIQGSTGLSCRLANAVVCAEKENKGWPLHHAIYDMQENVNRIGTVQELDTLLAQAVGKIGLNWERMQTCMTDPAVQDAVRSQAKQGVLVNVMGTPTFFANGRQLGGAQFKDVLDAARNYAAKSKAK